MAAAMSTENSLLLNSQNLRGYLSLRTTHSNSLEDEYGTISGLSFVYWNLRGNSISPIYTGWFLQNLSLQSSIFSLVLYQTWLVCYLILEEGQLWKNVSMRYFSPKCGHGVELCSLPKHSTKPCSSFEDKTYRSITGTAGEFNNVKAWKMTEVGNKPKFRCRKAVVIIKLNLLG